MPSCAPSSQCGFGSKSNCRNRPPLFHFNIAALVRAHRHFVARQVRNPRQNCPHLLFGFPCCRFEIVPAILQRPRLIHHRARVLAGLLQLRDLLTQLVALRLQVLGFGNAFPPPPIQFAKIPQQRSRILPALAQLRLHQLQIRTYKTQVEHRYRVPSTTPSGHNAMGAPCLPGSGRHGNEEPRPATFVSVGWPIQALCWLEWDSAKHPLRPLLNQDTTQWVPHVCPVLADMGMKNHDQPGSGKDFNPEIFIHPSRSGGDGRSHSLP